MFSFDKKLIQSLPPFTPNNLAEECYAFLSKHSFSHAPIINSDNKLIGNIMAEDIEIAEKDKIIEDYIYDLEYFSLHENTSLNIFEIFDLFTLNKTNILPVITDNNEVIGILSKATLFEYWPNAIFFQEVGKTIIISKQQNTFSLSEVAQIVESNNAKLYGILLLNQEDENVQILLKTNNINTNHILDDFRRYHYDIITQHNEDMHYSDLKDKSDYLNKYLNI
ncbi:CBS domain-containing protein [Myroides injenensis]|uniref:CBS domain-containing protein n=1 Tax=Myroides injenensis TaxID=1183151 RepID=UPI000288B05F|nr:CBS domain-containing protein [Myroides injenensis]